MNRILIALCLLFLVGCMGWGDLFIRHYKVGESYYVESEYRGLYYDLGGAGIGRIKCGVIAAGWNKKHLIIEQKRHNDKIYYFIIDVEKDHEYAGNREFVLGPYSKSNFLVQRKKLGVDPKLNFTKRLSNCCWIEPRGLKY